jgi:hypothetical protein
MPNQVEKFMSILIVQQIVTTWTKEARGGENAVKRNRVPEAAKLPVERLDAAGLILLQQNLFFGSGDFVKPREKIVINSTLRPLSVGCVTVYDAKDGVAAVFRYDSKCGGAPERGWARKTLRAAENEWAQIVYNGRFAPGWEGDWWYEKKVVNVGLFDHLTSGVFTRSAPTYRFEAMGELF